MISENARNYENVVIRNEQEIGINNFGLDYMVGLEEEIERLNNIIKEVREYIEDNSQMTDLRIHGIENVLSFRGSVEELLEILDKGA